MGFLKTLGRVGLGVGTGGLSEIVGGGSGVKDFLLGKKKGGFSADEIAGEIRRVQGKGILTAEKGLDKLNKALETSGDSIVRQQVEQQKKGVLTSAQDARRRAQQLMAQRGLQGSSLGLAADRSRTQEAGRQLATIQSQTPGLIRQQNLADAQMLQQSGQGLFGGLGGTAGIRFRGQEGSRSGGLLGVASALAPVAGTIVGGVMGGPMGAQMGSQAGGAIGSSMTNTFQPKTTMNYQAGSGGYA